MSFEQYVHQRLPRLLRIAQSICGDRQLGEDLVQDVLVKVHARWVEVQATEHPDAYVRRMIVNEHLSWRRKWGRVIPHADAGASLADGSPDHAEMHGERDALQREIRRLPDRQRVVVTLRYLADLSDAEIADALGCKQTTVRVHASRALAALRVSSLRGTEPNAPDPTSQEVPPMRTEQDIRRALDVEDDHPALARLSAFVDDLGERSAAPVASPSGGRLLPALAAAAAVVVVVGGGAALVRLRDDHSGPAAGARSAEQRRPVWNLRVAKVPGYTVTRVNASSIGLASGSTLAVASTNAKRPQRGVITTCPLAFRRCADASGARHVDVTVHGRPGYFDPATRRDGPGLSWYAGHHTTVFLTGTFGLVRHSGTYDNATAKKIMLRIASAVSAAHRDAATLPFELRDLPGRLAPEAVRLEHGEACAEYGTGPRGHSDSLGLVLTACRVRTGATRAATITAADRADSNPTNGTTRFEPQHPVVRDYRDGTSLVIAVERNRRGVVSQQRARVLAANADVSPRLGDRSTWIVVG